MTIVPSRAACSLFAAAALAGWQPAAVAQSEPFIGQIMCAGFNFAPRGWAELNGQLLPISPNIALFALLGTQYGGNGTTTFALPDMRGRAMIHPGTGAGLTNRVQGEVGGAEAVSLGVAQLPAHTHSVVVQGSSSNATGNSPSNAVLATTKGNAKVYAPGPGDVAMAAVTSATTGSGSPVPVMPPFIAIRCFIALQGIFPARD